jgi:tRNA 2-selenouridine synthase
MSLILPMHCRVELLMQDYAHFTADATLLNTQLACLTQLHGKEKIGRWHTLAISNQMRPLVEELLIDHYDPAYLKSIGRNFLHVEKAEIVELNNISDASFIDLARRILSKIH